jgi:hypothetical protein
MFTHPIILSLIKSVYQDSPDFKRLEGRGVRADLFYPDSFFLRKSAFALFRAAATHLHKSAGTVGGCDARGGAVARAHDWFRVVAGGEQREELGAKGAKNFVLRSSTRYLKKP